MSEDAENIEFTKSNKGNDKLCFNGFMYTKHNVGKDQIRWKCSKANSGHCKSFLITNKFEEKNDARIQTLPSHHNHMRDKEAIKISKIVVAMKERAENGDAKPSKIYSEAVKGLTPTTRAEMPLEESAKRVLRRVARKTRPATPKDIKDLKIEGVWETDGEPQNPQRLLLHDNGPDASSRLLVFATDSFLEHLANAEHIYFDGNFKLAPPGFQQLYVARVPIIKTINNEKVRIDVTACFALLQNKTKNAYKDFFKVIKESCEERGYNIKATNIHLDFELAAIQAAREMFGEYLIINGCFYHFSQSTHRKIQNLGLEERYRDDDEFQLFVGMLDGLAFLPEDHVKEGFELLKTKAPLGSEDLVTYFGNTYVTGSNREINLKNGRTRILNTPPSFPPCTWNLNTLTKEDDDKTNNRTEGWNNRFRCLVGMRDPDIYLLIIRFRCEIATDTTKLDQLREGRFQKPARNGKYVALQKRLKTLCGLYDNGDHTMESFLHTVGRSLRKADSEIN